MVKLGNVVYALLACSFLNVETRCMVLDEDFKNRQQVHMKQALENSYLAFGKLDSETCNELTSQVAILDIKARKEAAEKNNMTEVPSGHVERSHIIHCFIHFVGDKALAQAVNNLHDDISVKPDTPVFVQQQPESWGLDRVDQKNLPLSKDPFSVTHTGKGVEIYVLDTGLWSSHEEFAGRSRLGPSFIPTEGTAFDEHGHGTHCAGTAAGRTFGVARGAMITGVKVLSKSGTGSTSGIIKGIEWVVEDAKRNKRPVVISMSLGGSYDPVIDTAVTDAALQGHLVVVAAGNDAEDACRSSPAAAGGKKVVITVASSNINDFQSSFSNFGQCTDIYAPGSNIKSAWVGHDRASNTISGTSMATPLVAGVAAVLLQKNSFNSADAKQELFDLVVEGVIQGDLHSRAPNKLLQAPVGALAPTVSGPAYIKPRPTVGPTPYPKKICVNSDCLEFAPSKFGPPLGLRTIFGDLVQNQEDKTLCSPLKANSLKFDILLAWSGSCTHFTQVRNAQAAGASAVILVAAKGETTLTSPVPSNGEDDRLIKIPSVLVAYDQVETALELEENEISSRAALGPSALEYSEPKVPIVVHTDQPTKKPTVLPSTVEGTTAEGNRSDDPEDKGSLGYRLRSDFVFVLSTLLLATVE